MYDLTIIKQDGGMYIDSRDVAEVIGKRHDNLLRDIAGYLKIMRKTNGRKRFTIHHLLRYKIQRNGNRRA